MGKNDTGSSEPGPSRPLIQRPRTSAVPTPPQAPSSSNLGNAIAGALSGMGMTPAGVWNPAMMYSNPQTGGVPAQQLSAGNFGGATQAGQWSQMPQHAGGGVYNPAFLRHHAPQPPYAFPAPYYPQSMPAAPFYPQFQPHAPLTTAEGYSLSSVYVPPPPTQPRPANESGRPAKKQRRGGKSAADGETSSAQQPGPAEPVSRPSARPPAPREPQTFSCCKADCSFSGSKKQVREHEEDRHLIFAPGREPKPWQGTYKSGATIGGTGISLDSPEAVAKWIEDRKKRWPSNKVVAEKEAQRAERIAAGLERAPTTRGRGRGRGRGERGRGAMRSGRGGHYTGSAIAASPQSATTASETVKAGKAASSGSDSDSDSSDSTSDSDASDAEDSDDDGPPVAVTAKVEVPSLFENGEAQHAEAGAVIEPAEGGKMITHPSRLGARDEDPAEGDSVDTSRQFQVVCKYWRAGRCGLGSDCTYLHSLPPGSAPRPPPSPKRARPAPRAAPHNPFARPSDPFDQLAERDFKHIVSDVLQVVEFLSRNDWLRGVEMRAGQLDEESGIEVLQESQVDAKEQITIEAATVVKTEDGPQSKTAKPQELVTTTESQDTTEDVQGERSALSVL